MSRIAITDELRTLSFIESASKEHLDRLIDRAQLVKRLRFPDAAQPKPTVKRTRGPNKSKANGTEKESAGLGFPA